MKTILWYTSWTGHTELYADWLGKEIRKAPVHANNVDLSTLMVHDLIIYGGPVHSDKISGFERIRKVFPYLEKQRLVVFAVGTVPDSEENTSRLKAKNLAGLDQERIAFFYLRGGFDPERLSGLHKLSVNFFKFRLLRRDITSLTEGERSLLAAYSQATNYTDKEYLKPMLEHIKGLYAEQRAISPFR